MKLRAPFDLTVTYRDMPLTWAEQSELVRDVINKVDFDRLPAYQLRELIRRSTEAQRRQATEEAR